MLKTKFDVSDNDTDTAVAEEASKGAKAGIPVNRDLFRRRCGGYDYYGNVFASHQHQIWTPRTCSAIKQMKH